MEPPEDPERTTMTIEPRLPGPEPDPPVLAALSKPMRLVVLGWFGGGLMFVLGVIWPMLDVNPATAQAPITELVLGLMMMIGATLISFGQLAWRNGSTRWQLEMLGWPFAASSWLLYMALVIASAPAALFPLVLGMAMLASCIQRFLEVVRKSKSTRANVESWEKIRDLLRRDDDA